MNATSRSGARRWVATTAAAALAATTLGGLATLPAQAHDGVDHGDTPALDWSNYEKITLTKDTGEPIDLAVMPDLRVLTTARNGDIRLTDPDTGAVKVINTVPVYNNSEDGLQTVTLDPDFDTNKWVYLYYAPRTMEAPYPTTTPTGSAPNTLPAGADASYWDQWKGYNQLTRAKWNDATDSIDMATEQVIIKVETQRGQCCHVGGDVDFDDDGNVYIATGDNTPASTPGANGFAPNNDAPGFNPGFDSRRGAGNSNDLRGKIIRITVAEDGSYTVPAGNLFAPGTEKTRPEIFVMGVRNPFRMDVDPQTNSVTWGDYGPDAGAPDPNRGPLGYVEWQSTAIDKPINGGWPYCTGDQFNYNEWNYETATPREFFDCAGGPTNNSRWNTGLTQLPPATPATLYYGDNNTHQPWPELTDFSPSGGQGPMGGPVYHYDADNPSTTKFPQYWDKKAFFAEFSQDYLAAFTVQWPNGPVDHIEQFLPNADLETNGQPITDSPIDIEFGPDGSLYVLDYGDGFFRANPDAGLYRIDYAEGNKAPQAAISANPISSSTAPLTVTFDGSASVDPEGEELTYDWDFNGDGTFDATGVTASYTYTELGRYSARLRVTDPEGKVGLISTSISVGNVAPTVNITKPANGSFFDWGQAVPFQVSTTDPEDGNATVCSRVSWTFGLGHDQHAHPLSQGTGCQFAIPTPADATEHGETENIFGVVVITYTDAGANGLPGATTTESLILNPKEQQAEWADDTKGVEIVGDDTASGRFKVTSFDKGDHLAYDPANLAGITSVTARGAGTGTLALRWNSPSGPPFARIAMSGAADVWSEKSVNLRNAPIGTGKLYVTSTGGVVLDSLTFAGNGVADTTAPVTTVTTSPAAPNGANGWYTSDVTLTATATDDGTVAARERSTDGGATWVSATTPLVVSTEGVTTVQFRSRDNGGNVSRVVTKVVKLDKTAPVVTVSGVRNGASVGDAAQVSWVVTDATSGVATTSVTVDGTAVAADRPLDLWRLSLGSHRMVVTTTDKAGLTTSTSLTFTTTTSLAELGELVDLLDQAGYVSGDGASQLKGYLNRAKAAADAGRTAAAIREVRGFSQLTRSVVTNNAAGNALRRDADAVIRGWQ
ncbi:carbohydrate binding protein with CBM6 domain [Terracoccus luteus]|uniref:Carbohydrate binding protein with CBM6 domain n=1 Tax=Terracoccus luteus TaxID=53356 RepID=A0A495Y2P9_9MICO|nr:PQQ-dependent sugar dehydrogenase [Terracoccus luteus]RKT79346.1 carbohydrate binding protein with CBM6 domain [Terracoccus luteus]